MTRRSESYLVEEMNKEGQNGWELVDVLYYKDPKGNMAWTAFLKRPAAHRAPATSGDQKESSAKPVTGPENVKPSDHSSGFDLSGNEFDLVKSTPEEAKSEDSQQAKGK
jgi:hypothetical protein